VLPNRAVFRLIQAASAPSGEVQLGRRVADDDFEYGSVTGLNRAAVWAYPEHGATLVHTTVNPRRVRLVASLREGFGTPDNPVRTQKTTHRNRVHTGIVGRTSPNKRWQAEDCGRQMMRSGLPTGKPGA
jgi:hypothetical protein